jgi:tetratricopeptide (TPR) repeat protein
MLGSTLSFGALAHEAHHGDEAVAPDASVPLFEGLGDYHFAVTTSAETAQQYFDQGLIFTYGFDHFEAVRSFEAATRHDPECAMCYWGVALALGPHINAAMPPEAAAPAYEALERALELAPQASEREQAYIEALSARYTPEVVEDRSDLDRAYAEAMRELVQQYPDDLDALTLYAESLMNLMPWNYWSDYGEPRAETVDVTEALESVLAQDPYHPGATHYYIHLMELPYPERAEEAADNLSELNIQIGHMIHMPSHIYTRIGRWHDASVANQNAVVADEAYLAAYEVEGLVPLLYHPHNIHFLSWTAGIEGRSDLALTSADELVAATSRELAVELPFLNPFLSMPRLTMVRFGMWDEILAEPEPSAELLYQVAMWHYARGLALTAQGNLDEAQQEAASLSAIATSDEAQALELPEAFFPGATMMAVADNILQGELALAQGDEAAIALFEEAVARQDSLPYMEPPFWFASARLNLGRALLTLDRPDEAEAVFRADLAEYPQNGWTLYGLAESLRAQGNAEEAASVAQQFEEAWQHADIMPTLPVGE